MATGVGNCRAADKLAFRFLFDSFILLKNGRPVFEPPVVVINPKLAIDYWDAWLGIFFICSMTWSRL